MKSRLRKVAIQYPQLPAGYNPEMAVIVQKDEDKNKEDHLKDVYRDWELDPNTKVQEKNLYTF